MTDTAPIRARAAVSGAAYRPEPPGAYRRTSPAASRRELPGRRPIHLSRD